MPSKWVVDYTSPEMEKYIEYILHSKSELHINKELSFGQQRKQSIYLIFLEPKNHIRPYLTHMTDDGYLRWYTHEDPD